MALRRTPEQLHPDTDAPPADLVAGPLVTRWASSEHMAQVRATEGTPAHQEAVWGAMLNARTRWRDEVDVWVREHGLDRLASCGLFSRTTPYWPPKTD